MKIVSSDGQFGSACDPILHIHPYISIHPWWLPACPTAVPTKVQGSEDVLVKTLLGDLWELLLVPPGPKAPLEEFPKLPKWKVTHRLKP